ncbi:hypothetical protein DIPPA_19719 [Diplonema papillatum]|nr:hypothetical protein DIPPA_19719 [Diplonema papillatum]
MPAKTTLDEEKKEAMSMIWGGAGGAGAKKRGGKRAREAEGDADGEAVEPAAKGRKKKGAAPSDGDFDDEEDPRAPLTRKAKARKQRQEDTRSRTLHLHIDSTSDRNDVRTLFEDYDPKVVVQNYKSKKAQGKFALLEFKTAAMAAHALEKYNGTEQKDVLGVDVVKLSVVRSRRQTKKANEKRGSVKKAIARAKFPAKD